MLSTSYSSLCWFNICVCLAGRQWSGLSNVNLMRFFLLFLFWQLVFIRLQLSAYEKNMSSLGYVISLDERWDVASRPAGSRRRRLLRYIWDFFINVFPSREIFHVRLFSQRLLYILSPNISHCLVPIILPNWIISFTISVENVQHNQLLISMYYVCIRRDLCSIFWLHIA